MTAPTVVLEVRVYPSGTPGRVLLETVQRGPVYLNADEIARTLRSAAERFDDDAPPQRHRYFPGSQDWCMYVLADGDQVCGAPRDAPVHAPVHIDIRELVERHPDEDCPGLQECPQLQQVWRELAGGRVGVCMLCGGAHWPWEPHREGWDG